MPGNRSFVDFGRIPLLRNFPEIRVMSFETPRIEFLGIESHTPDAVAEQAVESHTPQVEERPLTRKESFAAWRKRSTALIEEHRRDHE